MGSLDEVCGWEVCGCREVVVQQESDADLLDVYIFSSSRMLREVSIVTGMSLGTGDAASMASKCERDRDDQKSINDIFFLVVVEVSGGFRK